MLRCNLWGVVGRKKKVAAVEESTEKKKASPTQTRAAFMVGHVLLKGKNPTLAFQHRYRRKGTGP